MEEGIGVDVLAVASNGDGRRRVAGMLAFITALSLLLACRFQSGAWSRRATSSVGGSATPAARSSEAYVDGPSALRLAVAAECSPSAQVGSRLP